MNGTRTDLALETVEELRSGGDISRLDGVSVAEFTRCGYGVTHVRVEGAAAARRLGKPEGQYVTVDLRPYFRREKDFFRRAAACVAAELGRLLQGMEGETVLVAGLGNRGMTADAVGPLALESLLVTRHMIRALPRQFRGFTPVTALAPGVLAQTGMEAAELLSEQLSALTARGDFPCGVAGLTWAETGFLRGCGAFGRRGLLTVYCTLAETPKEEDEA